MVPFLIASMRSITARESETLGSLNPVIRVDLPARSSCKQKRTIKVSENDSHCAGTTKVAVNVMGKNT